MGIGKKNLLLEVLFNQQALILIIGTKAGSATPPNLLLNLLVTRVAQNL